MPTQLAKAFPRKSFFVQMFTKDISLEDCILDLLDNSIDGLIGSSEIRLADISRSIFNGHDKPDTRWTPLVSVDYSSELFSIQDNCGGIDLNYALNEAFNFGHSLSYHPLGYLGAYGVGLKRAIFKIGRHFNIVSRTLSNGFACDLDVTEWVARDETLRDWQIPLRDIEKASGSRSAGTKITVTGLHQEVKMRLQDKTFPIHLTRAIERTYAFFLKRYVRVQVNGTELHPYVIPVGRPQGGQVSYEKIDRDRVTVRIVATVAHGDERGRLSMDAAGWYIVCNGRVVLAADKTHTTGWGTESLPQFVPKYRAFVGFVFFESQDPLRLPWTTTKRDLNKESSIYLHVRDRMALAARPVITFCNRKYGPDADEEPIEREISRQVRAASLGDLTGNRTTTFTAQPIAHKPRTTTTVKFEADHTELERIRKHLRSPRMGAGAIGRHAFEYFMAQEGLK